MALGYRPYITRQSPSRRSSPITNSRIATIVVTAFVCCSCSWAQNTQFRGPSGNGVYSEGVPETWNETSNVGWSVEIPGGGWSSPVVAGDRVLLTTAVADGDDRPKGFGQGVQSMGSFYRSKAPDKPYSFEVHCLNLSDGSVLWTKQIVSKKPPFKIHPSNSYATESPVTDGERVYVYFASVGMVACLDKDGQQLWARDLGAYKTGNDLVHPGSSWVR